MKVPRKNDNNKLHDFRVPIENVFGLIKGRWRRLKYIDVGDPKRMAYIISAACVLHNFCYLQDDVVEEIITHPIENQMHQRGMYSSTPKVRGCTKSNVAYHKRNFTT